MKYIKKVVSSNVRGSKTILMKNSGLRKHSMNTSGVGNVFPSAARAQPKLLTNHFLFVSFFDQFFDIFLSIYCGQLVFGIKTKKVQRGNTKGFVETSLPPTEMSFLSWEQLMLL